MAITNIHQIANYLLWFAREEGDLITNLKLQKLAYYVQAWWVANYEDDLFEDRFEAWVHGPVNRDLYFRFNDYRWNPITEETPRPNFGDDRVEELVNEVIDVYWDRTAYELERMTHEEAPWLEARGDIPPDTASTALIDIGVMRNYYRDVLHAAREGSRQEA